MTKREEKPIDPAALAEVRAALSRATGKRRLDLILDQPDPAAVVRALPADDLYLTIREVGLADAVELVQLASADQFRAFLDLAAWQGDHVAPRRALPWLRAARAGSTDSPRAAARWKAKLARLDVELVDLVLRDALRIHDLDADPDPHLQSDRFLRTPENRFIVEFDADGAEYMAVRGIVDDLYADDPFKATRLLASLRSELPSELEETALRWRTGRLSDLGYPSPEEALSWFAKPAARPAPPAGTPGRPAGFFLERLGRGSLLARAAARLAPEERAHLELELVTAANAVLVADAVDPGDLDEVRAAVEAARALVELGLEAVAGADEARAAEALATTAVKALFQRGFGRLLELRWRAERLLASGRAGTRATPLLDPPLGELLSALSARRPRYFPGLELPREAWGTLAAGAFEPRPFLASAEVARTAEALGLAEGLAALGEDLGLRPPAGAAGPLAPRLASLYLTALANERLGRAFAPVPIPAAELAAAARALAPLDDPRLARAGEAGQLLAALARARDEELAPLRDGAAVRPEHVAALLVAP
ncbi:DUF6178 family protein [Anaeromyxobacter diazotrophicus]|uniref:Uncharacterized protein n=1 Tax=Anaeromyxobacter diazotrophicus TaxID=2590199 RepID=A0A7I9VNN6_9BACT|nr:DUF6178 family protein [Anaeromyxobacter diazotrophicus]GEJ58024.1 hypothetical protein AMYX_27650 [Anaeromyxobacter diazotrophicus]